VSIDSRTGNRPGADNDNDRLVPMRLGAERPRGKRLSRTVMALAAAAGSAAILGTLIWALQNDRSQTPAAADVYRTEHHGVADGLTSLPCDYAGIQRQAPQLGPALPGDLGRPLLNAQSGSSIGVTAIDSEQQRQSQEIEAARLSRLFASTTIRDISPPVAQAPPAGGAMPNSYQATLSPRSAADDVFTQNGQDRKLAFIDGPVDRRTTSPDRLVGPASPYVVQAGSIIPASLITGIRSDLPGQITAQVTENV